MRFLIDEDLPRSLSDLIRRYGHEPTDVRDTGLKGAKDAQIAAYAQKQGLCLITGDFDFADIRNYPPAKYKGIVVLSLPKNATGVFIINLADGFLRQSKVVLDVSGKLVIVEAGCIRVRT